MPCGERLTLQWNISQSLFENKPLYKPLSSGNISYGNFRFLVPSVI